jgi:hypothetical protein
MGNYCSFEKDEIKYCDMCLILENRIIMLNDNIAHLEMMNDIYISKINMLEHQIMILEKENKF